jgi:beta-1,4-mannosyl-glycoprotein beta-1,4-N-acetylglucosaminyltransferase
MIYDCFPFHNELDILDVRLHELAPVVDKFVLVEARLTHQGQPKPLYFSDNAAAFREFADKIIHVAIDFPPKMDNRFARKRNEVWAREYHQRDQIALGLKNAAPDDLIMVSDVDEIVSAQKLVSAIRERPRGSITIFDTPSYEFYVNRRAVFSRGWLRSCPRMIEFSHMSSPQQLRMTKPFTSKRFQGTWHNKLHTKFYNWVVCGMSAPIYIAPDAGWHFTSIGGWERYRHKISSYAHVEDNQKDIFKRKEAFEANVQVATAPIDESTLPAFILQNRDRFAFYP